MVLVVMTVSPSAKVKVLSHHTRGAQTTIWHTGQQILRLATSRAASFQIKCHQHA